MNEEQRSGKERRIGEDRRRFDDPTYQATVEVEVVTSDGQEKALVVALWDYGLLTPWSSQSRGDGWKPLAEH